MPLPKWDKSYSVQNDTLDAQHKRLFEIAAKIEYIFDKPIVKQNLRNYLSELFNYMKEHFKDEEEYMEFISYPDFKIHRRIHREMIQTMIELISNIKTTNDLKEKLYFVIKKWLLEHILYEDMKVEEYRRSLISVENKKEAKNTKEYESDEIAMYFYTCECAGRIHDVSFTNHSKILNGEKILCKNCQKELKFYSKEVFTIA